MALYGKYRPQNFSDMIGQEAIKTTLLHSSLHNNISHASLFCGTRGTGKTTSARIVAKALNCQNILPTGDPCLECDLCKAAEEERMTDIIEIDAASNRGIDEIRALREKVNFAPNFGKAKIYIIDEVHMLTKEAFNALLKTLEEPPEHAYFILATTEFHKVPETIRSRCQTFFFRKISVSDIVKRLEYICEKEGIICSRKGAEIIAERSSGGLRDAISLLEQSASYGEVNEENLRISLGMISEEIFEEFLSTLSLGESKKALAILDALQDEGRNLEEFGKDLLGVLRKKFHEFLHNRDARLPWVLQIIEIFETALQQTKVFDIPPLALEVAVAKAMLLQKEFSDSLQVVEQNISSSTPSSKIEKILEKKQETKKQEKQEEKVEKINKVEEKKEEEIKTSPYDDDDMFPSSHLPENSSIPPWEEEKIIKKTPENNRENTENQKNNNIQLTEEVLDKKEKTLSPENFSGDFEERVKNHWNDLLQLLPKSLGTNIKKYGKLLTVEEENIEIFIEGESTRKLLNTSKNKEKIQEIFSEKFEKNISINFIGENNEEMDEPFPSLLSSKKPNQEKKEKQEEQEIKNEEIDISEMEQMLRF
jgi:DNA polymerase-3 subunit gamma/tau